MGDGGSVEVGVSSYIISVLVGGEETAIDLSDLSQDELAELRLRQLELSAKITSQLAQAKLHQEETGQAPDHRWAYKAARARRFTGLHIGAIDMEMGRRKTERRKAVVADLNRAGEEVSARVAQLLASGPLSMASHVVDMELRLKQQLAHGERMAAERQSCRRLLRLLGGELLLATDNPLAVTLVSLLQMAEPAILNGIDEAWVEKEMDRFFDTVSEPEANEKAKAAE